MKTKLIHLKPAWFTRSGIVAAAAIACGYWTSQILATWFVGAAEVGYPSWTLAALCLCAFVVLFLAHLLKPWSKTAAIFGLCSFAAFVGLMWQYTRPVVSPEIDRRLPSAMSVVLICTVFGVAGMAFDAARCWRVFRTHDQSKKLPADFAI
ncbi:MAG TPA: hypothetical protein VMF08_16080 [Candidatus Sulfotelmatobacter sp.]|nr:hypothetical protein [Candidatus Sulfotelmatobacter sp.]